METVVRENYQRVCERIAQAAARAGRQPDEVGLIAVTKYAELDWVRALLSIGVRELGESRPQQLAARSAELAGAGIHWHLIGHLQRNKVKLVLPLVTLIHSLDSVRLAAEIDEVAAKLDLRPRVLVEVNLTGEKAKHGFERDELIAAWEALVRLPRLRIEGLMTMAAYSDAPEDARRTFAALRELRDELRRMSPPELALPHLSMGMTGDFEVAIEEGATLVRIGSALWEGLP
jgi:PLP dependent protein